MHITAQTTPPPTSRQTDEQPQAVPTEDAGELAVDIAETATSIFIVAPIAGVDESSLAIEIDDDLLVIRGERKLPESIPAKAERHSEECFWGAFKRTILLPTAINSAEIVATLEQHILMIEIPKARKATSKTIPLFSRS